MNEKACPMCGETMLFIYGCGWDYDRLICGNRNCDYKEELKTISYPNDKQEKFNQCNAECSEKNPYECGSNCSIKEVKK